MLKRTLTIPFALACASGASADLLAVKVGRAETISQGVIEHAVLLIEDGKIVLIGEDLPIERGVPTVDLSSWTVTPGFVSCYTRIGMDSAGGDDMSPGQKASDELWPDARELRRVVEHGVTTLGVYPAGNGIPGQAAAIRPLGADADTLLVADSVYLKIIADANPAAKKRVRDGFKKADDYKDKLAKAREKWEKDQEKKKAPAKKDEKKEEEKKEPQDKQEGAEKPEADKFVPPEPDDVARAFGDLRSGKLRALVSISSASEYLHWLDALGSEKITWDLRVVLAPESDLYYVLDKKTYDLDVDGIGDRKLRVVIGPEMTVTPNTRRLRNLPADLAKSGARLCFTPRQDDLGGYERWREHVAELVAAGLDRDAALRALTLEPAGVLGVDARLGSLDAGKDANLVFFDGDPLEPGTRVKAVMLEGRVVFGEVRP
jgi:hypothetical protein